MTAGGGKELHSVEGGLRATAPIRRAVRVCRRAGLPVVDQHDCTCALRGRLVVLARAHGLELIWPYERTCPIHGSDNVARPQPGVRSRRRPARAQTVENSSADRQASMPGGTAATALRSTLR